MSVNIKPLPCSDAGACSGGNALVQKLSSDVGILALGSSVSSVVQLTASDDEAANNLAHCALRIAHCVLSDVALTQKFLRLSNSVSYRRTSESYLGCAQRHLKSGRGQWLGTFVKAFVRILLHGA
ncbi:MAG: hypothetical protein Q7J20_10380 [Candidatus Nitrotoga sp.]|nr:hypothetical protein [Candidatus Nitrotoga sp.]MDO9448277.1 hypothetical protein [Candidatus Nitrotoga sp.]